MTKKLTALAALVIVLLSQRPHAQGVGARIFFVDVGTGASTLIVSPAGKTLLVDGGPPGSGPKISGLLATLGITTIDYTIITHYHIDHMGGMIEVLNAGRVAGIAYDNGDGADVQPPGTSTSPASTRGTYLNYVTATGHAGVTRKTAVPGDFIDLGGGMRATFVAAGGRFLSGGSVAITTDDLNSESISTLIEYNDFDYLVSGDMTGGGSTSTAKTPDVETYVAQMVGDVDVVQLDHHGSTTANNQTFLSALKAEVAVAQTGETNTFGHPNRETANKFLNTPDTVGNTFTGTGVPPATGVGPVFYQNEASPSGDDRVTHQGYTGAAAGNAGQGTIVLSTEGTSTYSLSSFDDGGARIPAAQHTYAVDGVSPGVTTDFKPTVVVSESPIVPANTDSTVVSAAVNDRESPIASVTLAYSVNGTAQPSLPMTLVSGVYQATIPPQPDGSRVDLTVTGVAGGQTSTYSSGYFSGVTPIASLRALNTKGEPLYNGYAARIQGTVTASGFSSGTNDDYVQDSTGAVNVYKSTDGPTPFTSTTPGQVVEARGRVGFNGGRLRLDLTESVEKTTSPFGIATLATNPAPAPLATTFAALSTNTEAFEAQLVSIANVSLMSGTFPTTSQPLDTFVTVTDGTASFSLKLDHDTDADGFTPGATFTAVGIIQQDDYLRPFDSGYNLTPRSAADLGATAPPPPPLLSIAAARIDAVTNADGEAPPDTIPDLLGQVVKVRGAVTSIDFRGGNGIEYYIQDATGGIDLFSTSLNAGPFNIGDGVEATGAVTQFNGLTELTVTSVSSFPGAATATAPQVVTLSQLADGVGEALEGRLIRVNNVTITGGTFGAAGASSNVTIVDGTGTSTLRVDSDTDIDGTPVPSGAFSLIGLLSQFDSTAPFDSGYQILPRSLSDIITGGATCGTITVSGPLANGVAGAPYSQTVTASGGTSPFSFTISAGALPSDLTLSNSGLISGTPTAAGSSTFTVLATAADGCTGSASFTIIVGEGITATPLTVSFDTLTVGATAAATVTITNASGAPVTLTTPFSLAGPDAAQFGASEPGTTSLADGASTTAVVIFTPASAGAKNASLTVHASSGAAAAIPLSGAGGTSPTAGANHVLVSELRFHGPNGGNDEFVEIYNNTDSAVDISGWKLLGGNATAPTSPTPRASVPANVTLPARAHYLFANTAANGYSGAALPNVTYATGIVDNGGVALAKADNSLVDQVGVANGGTSYREGSPIATALTSNTNQGYDRKPGGQSFTLLDTDDNNTDFQLVVPSNPQSTQLTASPASIDFGSLAPPATTAQIVTIKNLLATAVVLSAPAIDGDATSFSVIGAGVTLPAGGSTTVTVAFQPSTFGRKIAALSIASTTAGVASVKVPLVGTAIGGIAVAPPSVDFGSVAPGSSAPATLTISNTHPVNSVTLTPPFTIDGTDASQFSVGAPASTTLGPGDSTPVVVSFQPTSSGGKHATLNVTSTTGGSQTVDLSGVGTCPAITVTGAPPSGFVGTPYSATFSASGANGPFAFSVAAGTQPTGLALGATGTLAGTPTAAGLFTFTVQASTPFGCSGSAEFTVSMTVPVITLTADPTSVDFGTVAQPGSATRSITLTNNTPNAITLVTPLTVTGPGAAQFVAGAPASTTLPALSSTTVSVTFTPAAFGSQSARLNVTSSGGGSATVALTGRAPAPVVVSEFRFRGPSGGNDEFVEIYNNTDAPIDISGYTLHGSNNAGTNSTRATVPLNTILAARAHYLFVNTGAAGYSGATPGNTSYSSGITDDGGVAIVDSHGVILDQVGLSPGSLYKEGANLTSLGTTNTDHSYERKQGGSAGLLQDSDDNATDFQVAAPSNPQSVVLSATPGSVDFGSISQLTSLSQNVVIKNLLLVAVNLDAPAIAGADSADFAAGAPSATTLAGGASATVSVTFHPSVTGAKAAALAVTSTNNGAVTVPLTGISTPDTTAPVLTLPGDITTEATGPATVVAYTATAIDAVDGPIVPLCSPASDSGFAVGSTTVSCTATDPHGNSSNGSFVVTITDHTAPSITVPADITKEATGAATVVTFAATASDLVDGSIAASCTPASGSGFPVGTTTVSCTATDSHGNSASSGFIVTVTDHTGPSLTVPASITTPATTAAGAVVTFTASAVDLVDGTRPVTCVPASGSVFALGSTAVACSTADLHGNAALASFSVLVTPKNPKPPKVTAPKNIRVEATGPTGAIVTFDASATDPFDGTLPVTCAPASGSMFPLGATLVTCSATNSSGRTDTDTTIITVRDATDPTIVSLTPSMTLLPNTDQVVPVSIAAVAVDIVDASPVCRITAVAGGPRDLDNDGVIDWTITGALTLDVQAVARKNKDRTYTITVKCTDASGNASQDRTAIVVSRAQ